MSSDHSRGWPEILAGREGEAFEWSIERVGCAPDHLEESGTLSRAEEHEREPDEEHRVQDAKRQVEDTGDDGHRTVVVHDGLFTDEFGWHTVKRCSLRTSPRGVGGIRVIPLLMMSSSVVSGVPFRHLHFPRRD